MMMRSSAPSPFRPLGRASALLWAAALVWGCDDGGGGEDPADGAPDQGAIDQGAPADQGSGAPDAGDPIPDAASPDGAAADLGPDGAVIAPCNSGWGALPEGLTELAWDDGVGVGDIASQSWSVVNVPLASAVLHEAVRFDLEHPARIHGFAVQYSDTLPDDAAAEVRAGLYADFGHNGFDFWAPDPLWQGARCAGDIEPGEWVRYVFEEPIEIDHPNLVYVAHRREGAGEPAWLFDGSPPNPDCTDDCCSAFANCHSAWNLPELTEFVSGGVGWYQWNGLSLSFQNDYLVRLYVEYTDDVTPEERLFQPVADVDPSNRMAWGDYDSDGDDDLIVNGPRLLRNDEGTFIDATAESGITAMEIGGSGAWGDWDNDGCLDLFVFDESNSRSDNLLRNNCDGTFSSVTEMSAITDVQDYNRCDGTDRTPTPAATFWDIDGDGLLDVYLANFICWEPGSLYVDAVWHNEGDGTFVEWTGQDGFRGYDDRPLASRGANPIDFDQDGDVDLFVNNYRLHPNVFYENQGDGTVRDVAGTIGLRGHAVRFGANDNYGHSIGTAWGDLDNDGDFDVIVANLAHPRFWDFSDKTEVRLWDRGRFVDAQGPWLYPEGDTGLRYQETHSVPTLGDFDQDGNLDLVISAVYEGRPTDYYWGRGDGTFELDAYHAGITVTNGWGQAAADFDNDGDLDLATKGVLFENTASVRPMGHWLQIRAVGNVASNRAALGATVRVSAGGVDRLRSVNGSTGQGCQDSLYLHFGLGDAETVDAVEINFPGGERVTYEGPFDADQRLWLYEDGAVVAGWVADP